MTVVRVERGWFMLATVEYVRGDCFKVSKNDTLRVFCEGDLVALYLPGTWRCVAVEEAEEEMSRG